MGISAVRLGVVGPCAWQARPGTLLALLPEPVNSDVCLQAAGYDTFADGDEEWDEDFKRLVESLLGDLTQRHGVPALHAPERCLPPRRGWLPVPRPKSPPALSPLDALASAGHDDQRLEFACAAFGAARSAALFTSDGHCLLWVWFAANSEVDELVAVVRRAVASWPCRDLAIDWTRLIPSTLELSPAA
ncbi:MAG: hypothetical protein JWM10_249 [Myxococcaceae bacterium]|nr:hypothetical protein [Myxococcaceae bacterium]